MHVDPIKRTLKPPITKRLKLHNDEPPSNVAFKINSRRYIKSFLEGTTAEAPGAAAPAAAGVDKVGWFKFTPVLKAAPGLKSPGISA